MLELLQFPPGAGLMNLSPFCMKVEVFLRLSGLEYRTVNALPMKSPTGKLPALRDGATLVADSEAILAHLRRRHGERLSAPLREAPTGAQHALRRMVEEDLYFAMLWQRWIDDAGWRFTGPTFFGSLPWPLRAVLPPIVRRKMRRDLVGQGTGRRAPEAIAAHAIADLDAVQAMLGQAPYFAGAEPGAIDATLYGFLANLLWVPVDSAPRTHLTAQRSLVDYCERMEARVGRA